MKIGTLVRLRPEYIRATITAGPGDPWWRRTGTIKALDEDFAVVKWDDKPYEAIVQLKNLEKA